MTTIKQTFAPGNTFNFDGKNWLALNQPTVSGDHIGEEGELIFHAINNEGETLHFLESEWALLQKTSNAHMEYNYVAMRQARFDFADGLFAPYFA